MNIYEYENEIRARGLRKRFHNTPKEMRALSMPGFQYGLEPIDF